MRGLWMLAPWPQQAQTEEEVVMAEVWYDETSMMSEEQWRRVTCWPYRNVLNHLYGVPKPKEQDDDQR